MRLSFFTFISIFSPLFSFTQFNGTWQGFMIPSGAKVDKASIVYIEFDKLFENCKLREEIVNSSAYAARKMKGKETTLGNMKSYSLTQVVIEKKKDASGIRWCKLELNLNYVDSSGYIVGTYSGKDCKSSGTIILQPSEQKMNAEKTVIELQSWRSIFIDDIKKGRKSLAIRLAERKNFQFQSIYFDTDKSVIKPEFVTFLRSMIKVVNSHTDLRIKVVGNTDAVGSDEYNIALSERRAKAIEDFFVANGLSKDRLMIEFKGEANPVAENKTEEGKQKNRRVDFSFI